MIVTIALVTALSGNLSVNDVYPVESDSHRYTVSDAVKDCQAAATKKQGCFIISERSKSETVFTNVNTFEQLIVKRG